MSSSSEVLVIVLMGGVLQMVCSSVKKERVLPFYNTMFKFYSGGCILLEGPHLVALEWCSPLTLSVRSCVVVMPSWCIIPSARHMGPCSDSPADIFVVMRGPHRSVICCNCAPCGLAYRHEPASLTGMCRRTPDMVYLLRTIRYSGHCSL